MTTLAQIYKAVSRHPETLITIREVITELSTGGNIFDNLKDNWDALRTGGAIFDNLKDVWDELRVGGTVYDDVVNIWGATNSGVFGLSPIKTVVDAIKGLIDGKTSTTPAKTADTGSVSATVTQADTTKIGYYLKPKLEAWANALDDTLTLNPLNFSADAPWDWLATLIESVYNLGIIPMFEFGSDMIIKFLKWLVINLAEVANNVFDAAEEWYGQFVEKYFFVAHTISTANMAKILNMLFDEVEDRTQQVGFTKFKPNLNLDDLPAGSINIWMPKVLLREAFSDPSMKMFGQTSIKWWMVIMDVSGLIAFLLALYFLPSKASQVFKILFKVRTVFKKKPIFTPYRPSLLSQWSALEMKGETGFLQDNHHRRYALD